ncbi:hypothetical protein AYI70_g184 [Smittium culicis]|uniref:Cation efflux protein transmembrane domain-containing protein n=1 Tax=Smittium culicis TaxID=133412 RepID=A0A1R1YHK8_9FUNG|nr:hypothetical protein AYI70_g184 [Smittium culicis]
MTMLPRINTSNIVPSVLSSVSSEKYDYSSELNNIDYTTLSKAIISRKGSDLPPTLYILFHISLGISLWILGLVQSNYSVIGFSSMVIYSGISLLVDALPSLVKVSGNNISTIEYPFGLTRLPVLSTFINGIFLTYSGMNSLKESLEILFSASVNSPPTDDHHNHSPHTSISLSPQLSGLIISSMAFYLGFVVVKKSGKILLQSITPELEQNITNSLEKILNIKGVISYTKNGIWLTSWDEPEGFIDVYVSRDVDILSTKRQVQLMLASTVGGRWTIQFLFMD